MIEAVATSVSTWDDKKDLWSEAGGTEDPVALPQGFSAALPLCYRELRHSWWEQCRCKTSLTKGSEEVMPWFGGLHLDQARILEQG